MENIKPRAKKPKKVITKLSNSGRLITLNQKYLTTESSEDDVTQRGKRKSNTATIVSEIARLRSIHREMQVEKKKTQIELGSSSDSAKKRDAADMTQQGKRKSSAVTVGNELARLKHINKETQVKKQRIQNERSRSDSDNTSKTHDAVTSNVVILPPRSNESAASPDLELMLQNVYELSNNSNIAPGPMAYTDRKDSFATSELSPQRQRNTLDSQNDSKNETNNLLEDANAIVEIVDVASQAQIAKLIKEIVEQNKVIIKQQGEIIEKLANIERREDKVTENRLYEPLRGFPLHTIDEFEDLERKPNKEKRNKLYNHLLLLGGSTVKEFLKCALSEIMTDQLVCEFKWIKTTDSIQFGDTRVANVMFKAAADCPLFRGPSTKKEFKDNMLEVLRVTKQRFRNSLKKSHQPENPLVKLKENEENILQKIQQLEVLAQESHEDLSEEDDFADDEFDREEVYERIDYS